MGLYRVSFPADFEILIRVEDDPKSDESQETFKQAFKDYDLMIFGGGSPWKFVAKEVVENEDIKDEWIAVPYYGYNPDGESAESYLDNVTNEHAC
jgi:hypothetical protein